MKPSAVNRLWRGYLFAVHAALAVIAFHYVVSALRPAADHPYIIESRSVQERRDPFVPAGAVLFLGDSNFERMPVSEVSVVGVNYAITWQRSDQLIRSMDIYKSMQRASAVVVMIGTNDVMQGKEEGLSLRYAEILRKVPDAVPVVMSSPPPVGSMYPTHQIEAKHAADEARAACAERKECVFVDAYSALSAQTGVLDADGVHLSARGYAVLFPLLKSSLVRTQQAQKSPD